MASAEDKSITCVDCGEEFLFTAGEQAFYRERGLTNEPTRCKSCREKRKAGRPPGGGGGGGGGCGRSEKTMYPAQCSQCGRDTEVPILAWEKVRLYLIPQRMFTGVDSFVLMAIPFFMLAGELMDSTGILDRMLKFAHALVVHIRGGIAHVNVVAGMILSGVSGSAVADASAIGSALLPVMRKEYNVDFGAGVVAGAAALGPIIPPSIPMIIYAASTSGMSVAALFLSGMIPGLMIGFGMMAIIYVIARKRGYPVRQERMTAGAFFARTKRAIPALIIPSSVAVTRTA